MDFGSGTLGSFRNAPQVGDVILSNDEEKIANTFKVIESELENRKKLFVNYNGDYQNYVSRSGKTVPYILCYCYICHHHALIVLICLYATSSRIGSFTNVANDLPAQEIGDIDG